MPGKSLHLTCVVMVGTSWPVHHSWSASLVYRAGECILCVAQSHCSCRPWLTSFPRSQAKWCELIAFRAPTVKCERDPTVHRHPIRRRNSQLGPLDSQLGSQDLAGKGSNGYLCSEIAIFTVHSSLLNHTTALLRQMASKSPSTIRNMHAMARPWWRTMLSLVQPPDFYSTICTPFVPMSVLLFLLFFWDLWSTVCLPKLIIFFSLLIY